MWINWIFRSSRQPSKCREVSSGPLSQQIVWHAPLLDGLIQSVSHG
jgi:hypothetical protein